jgi:hypothetical protein
VAGCLAAVVQRMIRAGCVVSMERSLKDEEVRRPAVAHDAFGDTGTGITFQELEWKTPIFSNRAVPKAPNASCAWSQIGRLSSQLAPYPAPAGLLARQPARLTAVKHPVRPYKNAIERQFTMENAKGA